MKQRNLPLIISLCLNALLGLYIADSLIVANQTTDYAQYNRVKTKLCGQEYPRILSDYDKQYASNSKMAADAKNSFAINVCQRNYKTGQQLNLQPLIDQVK